ncbi:MAG TPA: hypothetical protein P5181_10295 [Dermatophilaceae bacterium]|nr:hypothetical protein [Dermatophilaceae bacterium]
MDLYAALALLTVLVALVLPLELTHRRLRHCLPPTARDRDPRRIGRPQWW